MVEIDPITKTAEIEIRYIGENKIPSFSCGLMTTDYYTVMPGSRERFVKNEADRFDSRLHSSKISPWHFAPPEDGTITFLQRYVAGKKKMYQFVGEILGYKFHTAWNKLMYREWVVPKHDVAMKLCYIYGHRSHYRKIGLNNQPSNFLLRRLWDMWPVFAQLEKDNLLHLGPLVLTYQMTPKELQKFFGRGTWRQLANNSLSRNKLLCRYNQLPRIVRPDLMAVLQQIPSTILRNEDCFYLDGRPDTIPPFMKYVSLLKKERRMGRDWQQLWQAKHDMDDTCRMLEQRGETFNPNWSLSRIEEEHARLTELQQDTWRVQEAKRREDFAVPFEWTVGPGDYSDDSFSLVLLKTPSDIIEEGGAMHHCVASYISSARDGTNSFYSLRDTKGERLTTVQMTSRLVAPHTVRTNGLNQVTSVVSDKESKLEVQLGQHFGKYNRYPTKEEAAWVAGAMNRELSTGKPLDQRPQYKKTLDAYGVVPNVPRALGPEWEQLGYIEDLDLAAPPPPIEPVRLMPRWDLV